MVALESLDKNEALLLEYTTDLVCAFLNKNPIPVSEIHMVIESVYGTLAGLEGAGTGEPQSMHKPPVPIKKSVSHDYIQLWPISLRQI